MHIGNNFFSSNIVGLALAPQTVAAAGTANGATITQPWVYGRQISFILLGGAIGASATATCKVYGLKASDGTTWEALKEDDGTTDLAFTASKLADGTGVLENATILGTIDMSRIDGETYKAIRLVFVAAVQSYIVGAVYIISDLFKRPSSQTDDLFAKLLPSQTGLGL